MKQLPLELEPTAETPELRDLTPWERMLADYRHTSMSIETHPLALLRPHLPAGTLSSAELHEERHGRQVAFAGMTVARQRPSTAKGIVFMLLEDEHGQVNLIVPSEIYERHRATVRAEPLILARGRYERVGENRNVLVSSLESLGPLARRVATRRHRLGVAAAPALVRAALRLTASRARGNLLQVTDIRFARSGDVDIAYRVVGDGPIDLVYVQGSLTHLEVNWELPQFRRYCEGLAEFSRLILFDKRGMGMSDRVPGTATLEERMDDIRAIMDAIGSKRAAVMGESEGGPLAMLFAAAHPERTVALDPSGRGGPRAHGRRVAVGRRRQRRSSRSGWRHSRSDSRRAPGSMRSRQASPARNGRVNGGRRW